MTFHAKYAFAALAFVSFAFAAGCDREPIHDVGPPYSPSTAAAKAIELFDANNDGKIAGSEFDACPGLKASLKVIGTDAEAGVTPEQIAARVKKWCDLHVPRTSLACLVSYNGRPLADATVKFIPEKFLADALPDAATGKTNQHGLAMITVRYGEPGVPPGMYRVEITKDGEEIPAKYNTTTELGQEVSLDNPDLDFGVKFDLNY
jgi:hypothetical protein